MSGFTFMGARTELGVGKKWAVIELGANLEEFNNSKLKPDLLSHYEEQSVL